MKLKLLAILGRGIQRLDENGPWVLTEDFEVCGSDSGHLPVRIPIEDSNPHCFVGGGELNILAGLELLRKFQYDSVVCAYGHRSAYLKSINGPTESEIMSARLKEVSPTAKIEVWPREREMPDPSNTNFEIKNILELAVVKDIGFVDILTVTVHLPRAIVFAERHLGKTEFRHLSVRYHSSEQVLLETNADRHGPRVLSIYGSRAFQRSAKREAEGVHRILTNAYADQRPLWLRVKA